jgi:isopentenyldiphosphate isomerase
MNDNCPQVAEAADAAVRKVFAILGVNVDEPKEVEEFRENLRFGATMRRAADRTGMAVVGIIATALMASLWVGIVSKIKGHP